jgi:hypothetical protein
MFGGVDWCALGWGDGGIRALREEDAAGGVSCRDGAGGAVAAAVYADRAGLSEAGQWPPPVGVDRMLALYFLQHWFNLSDPAVEEALYDFAGDAAFVGIVLRREPVPDETMVCRPPPARGARSRPAVVRRGTAVSGRQGTEGGHRRARRRMLTRPAIPRCIRQRKETSGTSG